ncbi:MAG: hypothetical protein AUK06_01625 [Parcubacteria group bacterium CG2_30_36_18]|nr:MAG: hypothetical protein AUK06_01625 [Parcubacteria group bacterium CG2_30_36_18]
MPEQKIIFKGIPASPGIVKGEVKIVKSFDDTLKINGEIIVTSFLTPDFVNLIKRNSKIKGIITKNGGITCHAAIVAREYKIPYIAGVGEATEKLKNNMTVILDGGKGIIYETS